MTMPEPATEPAETVVVLPPDTRITEPDVAPTEAPALPADVQAAFAAVPQADVATEQAPPVRPDVTDRIPADAPRPTTPGALTRVDLGQGDWADIRDPKQVRSGHRKAVTRRLRLDSTLGTQIVEVMEEVLAFAILAWSLPLPVPSVNRDSLDELTTEQEDALQADPVVMDIATALSSSMSMLNPNRQSRDPNSPTGPSSV